MNALAGPSFTHESSASSGPALARGALHEVYAASQADAACLCAGALFLAGAAGPAPTLWIRHAGQDRESGAPCPSGLAELGLDPAGIVLVRARDALSALQAGLEGAGCAALGAVIVEIWGEARIYDLTASRRLALAAKSSGAPVFVARVGAAPAPSAAETRWLLSAAASRALAANAPGRPAFRLALLRARNGQEGLHYHLEWNRDAQRLERRDSGAGRADAGTKHDALPPAALSGAVAAFPANGAGAPDEAFRQRRAG